jgi:hypothetical protein
VKKKAGWVNRRKGKRVSTAHRSKERELKTHVLLCPNARFTHRQDQVTPGQQHHPHLPLLRLPFPRPLIRPRHLRPPSDLVQLVIKVIQHLRRRGVMILPRLPRIDHQPLVRTLARLLTHLDPVRGARESELGVPVVDGGEVAADDGEVGVELCVVPRHFEEAQVEEGDGGVGTAGDEDEGGLGSRAGAFECSRREKMRRDGV